MHAVVDEHGHLLVHRIGAEEVALDAQRHGHLEHERALQAGRAAWNPHSAAIHGLRRRRTTISRPTSSRRRTTTRATCAAYLARGAGRWLLQRREGCCHPRPDRTANGAPACGTGQGLPSSSCRRGRREAAMRESSGKGYLHLAAPDPARVDPPPWGPDPVHRTSDLAAWVALVAMAGWTKSASMAVSMAGERKKPRRRLPSKHPDFRCLAPEAARRRGGREEGWRRRSYCRRPSRPPQETTRGRKVR